MNTRNKVIAGAVLALVLAVGSVGYTVYGSSDTITATVTGKDRSVSKDESKWIVMTDKMSFENTDSLFHAKFNSTDIQGQLVEGNTYEISYYGFRVPFLSIYPNITDVVE